MRAGGQAGPHIATYAVAYSYNPMLIGASESAFAVASNVPSTMATCGGLPTAFSTSRPAPVRFQQRPVPVAAKPANWRFKVLASSVAFTIATTSALRSAVNAAETSSGHVALPVFYFG